MDVVYFLVGPSAVVLVGKDQRGLGMVRSERLEKDGWKGEAEEV